MKSTRKLVLIGMLAAVSVLLTFVRIPIIPPVYDLDFSEIPVLIGTFTMGPTAGIAIEGIKAFVDFLIGSHTGGIGELAQFIMGCALCIPAGIIYKYKKTKKQAMIALATSVVVMIVVACIVNRYIMLPLYLGNNLDSAIQAISVPYMQVKSATQFIFLVTAPFNLLKGGLNALLVALIYKRISPIFKK